MDKTLKFEIVTGINKGYFHDNSRLDGLDFVGGIWQQIARDEFEKSSIYISAVLRTSRTVYNEEWGCPKNGEETIVITGIANKEFVDNIETWKNSVINLAKILKEKLKQSTLTCEFIESELYYFKE